VRISAFVSSRLGSPGLMPTSTSDAQRLHPRQHLLHRDFPASQHLLATSNRAISHTGSSDTSTFVSSGERFLVRLSSRLHYLPAETRQLQQHLPLVCLETTNLSPEEPQRRNSPILHKPNSPSRRRTDGDSENQTNVEKQALLEET
jgi:hypothetical protein